MVVNGNSNENFFVVKYGWGIILRGEDVFKVVDVYKLIIELESVLILIEHLY